jgi:predicted Zn-dependent protease
MRRYPDDAKLYRLLAQAYAQNNQKADAYQARAKAYQIDGYNRQAGLLLQQALKMPKLSTNDRAIINARIEQLKENEKNL